MRLPDWVGVGERRWKKSPDEEVQPRKTAWDFLQLLIVPLILVTIGLVFNAREQEHQDAQIRQDRALAEAAREDETLDAYYATMGRLMLDRHLISPKPRYEVSEFARTTTLAAVRRLDGARKGEVVKFLYEAGLLATTRTNGRVSSFPIISLDGADLRGADLRKAELVAPEASPPVENSVDLRGDLRGARFDGASLYSVDLSRADLRGASFRRAFLAGVSFAHNKQLGDVSFMQAELNHVSLGASKLTRVVFDGATFIFVDGTFACMHGVSFLGAKFPYAETLLLYGVGGRDVDFTDARSLSHVILGGHPENVRFGHTKQRPTKQPAKERAAVRRYVPWLMNTELPIPPACQ
jgi:hypothetical protein